jgi:hypothetical protein
VAGRASPHAVALPRRVHPRTGPLPLGGQVLAVTLAPPLGPGTNVADVPGPPFHIGGIPSSPARIPAWKRELASSVAINSATRRR